MKLMLRQKDGSEAELEAEPSEMLAFMKEAGLLADSANGSGRAASALMAMASPPSSAGWNPSAAKDYIGRLKAKSKRVLQALVHVTEPTDTKTLAERAKVKASAMAPIMGNINSLAKPLPSPATKLAPAERGESNRYMPTVEFVRACREGRLFGLS
ncbi:MAG: hypothetical protein U0166_03150 [Acidobacteriota bacterium]